MIKVLHLLPMNKLSGAEKMALLICKNQKEFKTVVATGGPILANVFRQAKIPTYELNFSMKNILKTASELKEIIKKDNIDIIHAHDNTASLSAYIAKRRYNLDVKIVSHIHNCYPWLTQNSIQKWIDRSVRPHYNYNIACGQLVYEFYETHAPYFNPTKTLTLSNAMDMKEMLTVSDDQIQTVRVKYNLPTDKKIIGFIGRLSEQKGLIPFLKALAPHKEQFTDCCFLLVGNGEQEEKIKQLISDLNLNELFILTGFQDNVYPFYPLIDVFFLPSLYEGLPMVLLEAMAFGCTVVSMDVGSISEAIKHQENGYLVQEAQTDTFIQMLIEVTHSTELIGKRANQTIENQFNITKYNDQLLAIYTRVLKKER